MTTKEYQDLFQSIINQEITTEPYTNIDFLEYTKLNHSRFNRWLKNGEINSECIDAILAIDTPMQWLIISEPWCGDAAHSVPFLIKLGSYNSLIDIKFQLRDSPDSEIDKYLTNQTKSIPILVARRNGKDIFRWGPRPKSCQEFIDELKKENPDLNQIKEEIQKWYNSDKGTEIQTELLELLRLS
jgi:hypothetical protein